MQEIVATCCCGGLNIVRLPTRIEFPAMRSPKRHIRGLGEPVAIVLLTAAIAAAPRAQQQAAKPPLPVAANTVARNPEPLLGRYVSLVGTVERILSPTAFSVDQNAKKSTEQDVLILAPRLNAAVHPNTYLTVLGEVIRFDPAAVAKSKTHPLDLPPEVMEKYRGRPAILAVSVIDVDLNDLAKWLPPPMTPEEEAFDALMKRVGPANASLRKAIEGSDREAAMQSAADLSRAFREVEAFWTARRQAEAVRFAQEARRAAGSIEMSAKADQWDQVKADASTLRQQCQSCHAGYRQRGEDGSFFLKPNPRSLLVR